MMVVLGVDAHKRTHTIVACDEAGAQLGSMTVSATTEGHLRAVKWVAEWETRNHTRFRLNRGGNRQTNAAIHRIAVTQLRIHPPAKELIQRHMSNGKTKREALRILKRRLSDVVHRTMTQDTQSLQASQTMAT
ncbi:MAG: IS110 family transposase [Acidimicrobiia bacterium]|nr:IS110 family transposase [Acidimicrobiia bacterium]